MKKTHEKYCEQVKEIWGDKIQVLEPYINDSTKSLHRCTACGTEWYIKPNDILNHHGCPKCAMKKRKSVLSKVYMISPAQSMLDAKARFLDRLKIVLDDSVVPLEEYKGSARKMKVQCKKCGKVWYSKPNWLLSGHGCGCDSVSKGEKKISGFLKSQGILAESEKSFDDLVGAGGRKLRFDFYIDELKVAIEYQGKQHYKAIKRFGGEETFKTSQLHDELKRKYCAEHGIKEIEIPYTDYKNIEVILGGALTSSR